MNILRHVAQFALDLNKIHLEALVRLHGRLGFYKKLYAACGLPDGVAARLEEKMIRSMFLGVEEQHGAVEKQRAKPLLRDGLLRQARLLWGFCRAPIPNNWPRLILGCDCQARTRH